MGGKDNHPSMRGYGEAVCFDDADCHDPLAMTAISHAYTSKYGVNRRIFGRVYRISK